MSTWKDYILIDDISEKLPKHSWEAIKKSYPEAYAEAKKNGSVEGEGLRWKKRSLKHIDRVIVHQTAGGDDPYATSRYHIRPNHVSPYGMPGIGYHFYIPKLPKVDSKQRIFVFQVNPLENLTWHTKGCNTTGVGVVCGGSFYHPQWRGGKENPTSSQMKAVSGIWMYLKEMFNLTDRGLYGHFQFGKAACPGQKLEEWVQRTRMAAPSEFSEDHWEDIQFALQELGFDPGPLDGVYGPRTRGALQEFEELYKAWGMTVDGYWDDVTKDVLELVWAAHKNDLMLPTLPEGYGANTEKEFE